MIDWSKCLTIDSDTILSDVEHPFRVFAGPGAGKTHWLVNHIKNTLQKSNRLGLVSKIACITYTNTGVEEIQSRLQQSAERVDVSTIHSFLYKNIVKPFSFLLIDEEGNELLDGRNLDGHQDHVPSFSKVKKWITNSLGSKYYYLLEADNRSNLYDCLNGLHWNLRDNQMVLAVSSQVIDKAKKIRLPNRLYDYKKEFWRQGIIHHDDVLYLSYELVTKHPHLLRFIAAKFPYIFIDEFQDTNPIQTEIIRNLACHQVIVGVIGDLAQSIYKFQGANRDDFINFKFERTIDYKIEGNKRSTDNIILLLNHIRSKDLLQTLNNRLGRKVTLMIGDIHIALQSVMSAVDSTPVVLARSNEFVAQIRNQLEGRISDLWRDFKLSDGSSSGRFRFMRSLFLAIDLMLADNYTEATRVLAKEFRNYLDKAPVPELRKREYAINILQKIVSNLNGFMKLSLLEFYGKVHTYILDKHNISIGQTIGSRGSFKDFSTQCSGREMLDSLKTSRENHMVRTIHKAKGAEFETVMVAYENKNFLKLITHPDIHHNNDEYRLCYVALSRAKSNLFICVNNATEEQIQTLYNIGLDIIYV